jgi:restriction endonuclease S subunit
MANANISGARMPRVTTKFLKEEIQLPLPSLDQQQKIVAYLDENFTSINHLKSAYQQKLTSLQTLKSSILSDAFTS